ncbi:hypothetical protein DTO166G4_2256 [Paecilomyces variotii]|uniref:FHA domain protein n=1 Tax=Byssochlamys spectabilis TaxID=264951 RepID=A0A443I182_BYSSP|nr:hypothetical protein C8Q69DRAFT_151109 [Paecilomyces variotii]KAJ9216012.1 hypothetical protein DTO166G4_2256 [Paecilomyces variotii]KAJ9219242.1 hypothetical protein DTO169C6_8435 [Paecilomyces variotii]KAJ9240791.1 hypothetical protein DTO166G5_1600 [Paecilomyces variotii]KAJ9244406.1 hypothetical protein DTO169E5_1624 [Paecilomyces variotii]KAJ9247211.1 hypothetical protein DTO207G8_8270 [Paecilomyces variotii]
MSASTASSSNIPPGSPSSTTSTRSGRLRRLSQLRSYTQNHLAAHSSSGHRSYRNTLTRVVGLASPSHSSGGPESPPLTGNSNQGPCPAPAPNRTTPSPDLSVPSAASFSGGSSSELPAQVSSESLQSSPSDDPESQPLRGMTRPRTASFNRPESAGAGTGGSLDAATPLRADVRSSESTPLNQVGVTDTPASPAAEGRSGGSGSKSKQKATIRFYAYQDPHQNSRPSLPFAPVTRALPSEDSIIRVGRYSEREGIPVANPSEPSDAPVGFKSKVVSRKHCEFSFVNGQWHIKDVGSSSGTFLNHMRLSQPNMVSRLYAVRDGDIVQLGIDFRGGEEMIFRCVRIRIECNRSWQQRPNEFNKNTESLINNLGKGTTANYAGCRECSICLGSVLRPYQCLFMAACAHVWHYKCIRRLIHTPEYPMFQCPNCRAYTDLSAEVDDSNDYDEEEEEAKQNVPVNNEESTPEPDSRNDNNHPGDRSEPTENSVQQQGSSTDGELAAMAQNVHLEGQSTPNMEAANGHSSTTTPQDSPGNNVERSASIDIPGLQSLYQSPGGARYRRGQSGADSPVAADTFEDNPLTPRNDSGPLAFDGRAGRS